MEVAAELNKLPILQEIEHLRQEINQLRPLPKETEQRILQKLRLDWNYHSNAIEGNTLSYGETVAFLMHGLTAKGKPLKDHLDIRGHNKAINFLLGLVKDERPLTEADIRSLHKMILVEPYTIKTETPSGLPSEKTTRLGEYKQDPNHVKTKTGEIHYYATPEETPAEMGDLMQWYQQARQEDQLHPVVIASLFHHKFVAIHPFDDGNGRMGRLLMNLILMQYQYPPLVVKQEDRSNYYQVLSQADAGEFEPLVIYFGELMKRSLTIYLKGAKGESLVEAEDIDKEIALFKKGLSKKEPVPILSKNSKTLENVFSLSIYPLLELLLNKAHQLDDLFEENVNRIKVQDSSGKTIANKTTVWLAQKPSIADDIEYLQFVYAWRAYRYTNQPFNISIDLSILLAANNYTINNKQNLIEKRKNYHEYLTPEEMNLIVKEIIGKVMEEIKQKTQA